MMHGVIEQSKRYTWIASSRRSPNSPRKPRPITSRFAIGKSGSSRCRPIFRTGEGRETLDGKHCAAIVMSHIYAGTIFYPPTIKELIATGRIVLIRDHTIRTAILSFDQTNDEISQLRKDIQIDRIVLARIHPGLISLGPDSWEDATCDYESMASDQAFRNDFTDNSRRFGAYVDDVTGRQSEILKSLGTTVAAGLGRSTDPD